MHLIKLFKFFLMLDILIADQDADVILRINPHNDKSNYSYRPILNLNVTVLFWNGKRIISSNDQIKMPEIGYWRGWHLRSLLLLLYGNVNINNYNKREIIASST
uniref:Uncharacterized protein n=1 Tax=Glossina pallidipes TaxID=7398 RepID=A0A1A9ZM55_GLOPL